MVNQVLCLIVASSQACPTKVSQRKFKCPARVPCKLSTEVPGECPTKMSSMQTCPTTMCDKEYLTRVSYTRTFCQSVPPACRAQVSYENVLRECPSKVPHKISRPKRASQRNVKQKCRANVCRNLRQEYSTRVHKTA